MQEEWSGIAGAPGSGRRRWLFRWKAIRTLELIDLRHPGAKRHTEEAMQVGAIFLSSKQIRLLFRQRRLHVPSEGLGG